MKDLKNTIKKDLIKFMKEKNQTASTVLRNLNSEIKKTEIDLKKELDDNEILKILKNQIKKYKDSIEQFKKAGREDLVKKEEDEMSIIKKYAPKELSKEEIENIVEEAINESGAKNKSDIGKVMPLAMSKSKGQADGGVIKDMVLKKLSQ